MSDENAVRSFVDEDLHEARFVRTDLAGAVMRAVHVGGMEIEAPWLIESGKGLFVNGVNVAPFVDAELNRRFPGRELRRASTPDDLRSAWAALESAWAAAIDRASLMPEGTVDVSVQGEWSFAQTLRHLVMATDTWLGRAILEQEQPYHPLGEPNAEYATDGLDTSIFWMRQPSYAEVLEVRAGRQAMVRGFLADVTEADLSTVRRNPWAPDYEETTLSCLHTILEEEWEHLRYAVRDLDAIASNDTSTSTT